MFLSLSDLQKIVAFILHIFRLAQLKYDRSLSFCSDFLTGPFFCLCDLTFGPAGNFHLYVFAGKAPVAGVKIPMYEYFSFVTVGSSAYPYALKGLVKRSKREFPRSAKRWVPYRSYFSSFYQCCGSVTYWYGSDPRL